MVFILVLTILFLDQFTKFLAAKNLSLNQPLAFIKGAVYLTLVHNRGAAFGILKNQTQLFIFTSLVAVVFIYLGLKKNKGASFYSVSLGLILAGALGNLIDRVTLGYVVDFLDFRIWPVFNVADSAITIGAIMLGYYILCKNKFV